MTDSNNNENKAKKQDKPSPALNYLLLSAGSIFTSMLIAGFIVGYVIDQLFDTTPIFMLCCAVLGFVGGLQKVHKLSSRLDQPTQSQKDENEKS